VAGLDLLVVGDAMVDLTVKPPPSRKGGAYPSTIVVSPGGLGNVAAAAADCGARVGFAGRVGKDVLGEMYIRDLRSNGVRSFVRRSHLPTGICINFIHPGGERTMYTTRGANDLLVSRDVPDSLLRLTRMVFVSGFSMETAKSATEIEKVCNRAKARGSQVAVGGGAFNIITRRRERFRRMISSNADILVLNQKEALALSGKTAVRPALDALQALVGFLVVTLGRRGSILCRNGSVTRIPAPRSPGRAIDTTGAGDVFAGTLLAGLLLGKGAIESIRQAHIRAGKSVAHLGPRPPRWPSERSIRPVCPPNSTTWPF